MNGNDTGLQLIALAIARHRFTGAIARWLRDWSHPGGKYPPVYKFRQGIKALHMTARVTVEQSTESMIATMQARLARKTTPHLVRLNDVKYRSSEIRHMPLVAGQMRARETVRKLAASRRPSTSNR